MKLWGKLKLHDEAVTLLHMDCCAAIGPTSVTTATYMILVDSGSDVSMMEQTIMEQLQKEDVLPRQ